MCLLLIKKERKKKRKKNMVWLSRHSAKFYYSSNRYQKLNETPQVIWDTTNKAVYQKWSNILWKKWDSRNTKKNKNEMQKKGIFFTGIHRDFFWMSNNYLPVFSIILYYSLLCILPRNRFNFSICYLHRSQL